MLLSLFTMKCLGPALTHGTLEDGSKEWTKQLVYLYAV